MSMDLGVSKLIRLLCFDILKHMPANQVSDNLTNICNF